MKNTPVHNAFRTFANPDDFLQLDPTTRAAIEFEAHGRGEGDQGELPKDPLGIVGYLKASLSRDLLRYNRISIAERKMHYRVIFATCAEEVFEREFATAVTVIRRLIRGDTYSSAAISINLRAAKVTR